MNMSIVKPGILGRCFIFLVNAECVGIGCHWHGTQENTIFSWNLVLSSLYFILWLWKKTNTWNWNLQLTWGRHLRHCTNIATGVIPLDGLSPICAIAYQVSVCVCQKTQRIESTREGGRERERGNIVLHNANTSNGFRSSPGVHGANHFHFYPPFWSFYPGHQFWPMHGS